MVQREPAIVVCSQSLPPGPISVIGDRICVIHHSLASRRALDFIGSMATKFAANNSHGERGHRLLQFSPRHNLYKPLTGSDSAPVGCLTAIA